MQLPATFSYINTFLAKRAVINTYKLNTNDNKHRYRIPIIVQYTGKIYSIESSVSFRFLSR